MEPKSQAGRRRVPIAAALRAHLAALALKTDRSNPDGQLVFGDGPATPYDYAPAIARAQAAWAAAGLEPCGLHAARHTAAGLARPHAPPR